MLVPWYVIWVHETVDYLQHNQDTSCPEDIIVSFCDQPQMPSYECSTCRLKRSSIPNWISSTTCLWDSSTSRTVTETLRCLKACVIHDVLTLQLIGLGWAKQQLKEFIVPRIQYRRQWQAVALYNCGVRMFHETARSSEIIVRINDFHVGLSHIRMSRRIATG